MNCYFQDFDADSPARGIHIDSAVKGFRADVHMWGFSDAADDFLDIDSASIQGVEIVIRGNSTEDATFPVTPDADDAAQYVDIPELWDSTNSITIINEANGNSFELVPGTAY